MLTGHWSCWMSLGHFTVIWWCNVKMVEHKADVLRQRMGTETPFSLRYSFVCGCSEYLCFLVTICGQTDQRHNIVLWKLSTNIYIPLLYRGLYFYPLVNFLYIIYWHSLFTPSIVIIIRPPKSLILNMGNLNI